MQCLSTGSTGDEALASGLPTSVDASLRVENIRQIAASTSNPAGTHPGHMERAPSSACPQQTCLHSKGEIFNSLRESMLSSCSGPALEEFEECVAATATGMTDMQTEITTAQPLSWTRVHGLQSAADKGLCQDGKEENGVVQENGRLQVVSR
jgi:hypothetical protein